MKITASDIKTILLIAAVIILIIMFFSHRGSDQEYKFKMAMKDSAIQTEVRGREQYRRLADDLIQELRQKDSLLQIKYTNNIKVIYEKIPVHIRSLSKDSLRAAGERAAN